MKKRLSVLALMTCALLLQFATAEETKGTEYDHCVQAARSRLDDCTSQRQLIAGDPPKTAERNDACMERWQRDVADCDRNYKG